MGRLGDSHHSSHIINDGKDEKSFRTGVGIFLVILTIVMLFVLPAFVLKWYLLVVGIIVGTCAMPQRITIADNQTMGGSMMPHSSKWCTKEVGDSNVPLVVIGLIMAAAGGIMLLAGAGQEDPAVVDETTQEARVETGEDAASGDGKQTK